MLAECSKDNDFLFQDPEDFQRNGCASYSSPCWGEIEIHAAQDEEIGQDVDHIDRFEPPVNADRQAFMRELVDEVEHPVLLSLMGAVLDEVIGPDMVPVFRAARQSGCEVRDNQDEVCQSQRFDDCRATALDGRQRTMAALPSEPTDGCHWAGKLTNPRHIRDQYPW